MRSGIEILAALPKLYWKDHALPGTEWIKFTKREVPKDRLWISLEEEESFSPWIALPGRKNLGLGRHWHFFSAIFWGLNGIFYYVMLFTSGGCVRLIPASPSIFSEAIETALIYASLQSPPAGDPYNPLQQLTYFGVVFMLGPFMIATGAAMSPAIDARFPWYPKIFGGRQAARSLHFLGMVAFVLFVIAHILLVVVERFPENMGNILLGNGEGVSLFAAIGLFAFYAAVVVIIHAWATSISLRNPRVVQNALDKVIVPAKWLLLRKLVSKQYFQKSKISPFFRVNGYPPDTKEYKELLENNFANWKLKVYGLIENPLELPVADLQKMPKQTQITEHYCIQGWTAIGGWTGVPMSYR